MWSEGLEDGGNHRLDSLAAKAPIRSALWWRSHPKKSFHDKEVPQCFHGDKSHDTGKLSGDLWWYVSDGTCVHQDASITDNASDHRYEVK